MSRLPLPLCLFAVAACGPLEATDGLPDPVAVKREAVLSGQVTFNDPNVFLLYLRYQSGSFLCSSSLIGKHTLLTAAHCVQPDANGHLPHTVATNAYNIEDPNAQWINVTQLRYHPAFNEATLVYDVASVELEFDPPVPTKPRNREPLDAYVRHDIRVVGYGITDTVLDNSGLKRTGSSLITAVKPTQFQFGRAGVGKNGTCSGDSGGPALMTFPDGVERVIGIHSFHSGECGQNTDTRVDVYSSMVDGWLQEFEGPTCASDGRCQATGCDPVDPDCACVEDSQCNAACASSLYPDPDCATSCGADGVCAAASCTPADPDCQGVGSSCGYPEQCNSRLCLSDAQHPVTYCSQSCSAPADCPASMECVGSQCKFKQLPTANEGEACTPGETYCLGTSRFCAGWEKAPATVCTQGCVEDADCDLDETCRPSPQAPGVCVPNIVLGQLGEASSPARGCASVPGGAVVAIVVLGVALRRRSHQVRGFRK